MLLITFGLDNGREVDVQAPTVDAATVEIARAYPGVGILGFSVAEVEDTDTTDETVIEDDTDSYTDR